MRPIVAAVCFAGLSLLASPSFADSHETEESAYARSGYFVGLGGGFAHFLGDEESSGEITTRLGYREPRFAGAITSSYVTEGEAEGDETSLWTFGFDARGYAFTDWRYQPFATIGFDLAGVRLGGDARSEDREDLAVNVGVGVEPYLTEQFSVDLGIRYHYLLPADDFDYLTVRATLLYYF